MKHFATTVIILFAIVSVGPLLEAAGIDSTETAAPAAAKNQPVFDYNAPRIGPELTEPVSAASIVGFDSNNPGTAELKSGGLCSCGGVFRTGDRVVAAVDNPTSASGILTGHAGTVGCAAADSGFIYIIWDDWVDGHMGSGNCDCPDGWNFNAPAGWYVECHEIAPIVNPSAQSVCGGEFWAGSRVRAIVNNPEGAAGIFIGREGRVVCGDNIDPLPLLVAWDGWDSGHQGSSFCNDPATSVPLDVDPNWWIGCSDIESASEAGCVCGGYFAEGERVSAAVDNPEGAQGILKGHLGTVICGQTVDERPLISWDDWTLGHNGNGFCECPVTSLPDNSGRYTSCDVISKAHGYVYADGFYTGNTSNWD